MTAIGIDIESFSHEELKQMVIGFQGRIMALSTQHEIDAVKIKALEMENAVVRDLLSRKIIGIVVEPTMIPTGPYANVPKEVKTGEEEEETKPVKTDDSEKDKFQA